MSSMSWRQWGSCPLPGSWGLTVTPWEASGVLADRECRLPIPQASLLSAALTGPSQFVHLYPRLPGAVQTGHGAGPQPVHPTDQAGPPCPRCVCLNRGPRRWGQGREPGKRTSRRLSPSAAPEEGCVPGGASVSGRSEFAPNGGRVVATGVWETEWGNSLGRSGDALEGPALRSRPRLLPSRLLQHQVGVSTEAGDPTDRGSQGRTTGRCRGTPFPWVCAPVSVGPPNTVLRAPALRPPTSRCPHCEVSPPSPASSGSRSLAPPPGGLLLPLQSASLSRISDDAVEDPGKGTRLCPTHEASHQEPTPAAKGEETCVSWTGRGMQGPPGVGSPRGPAVRRDRPQRLWIEHGTCAERGEGRAARTGHAPVVACEMLTPVSEPPCSSSTWQ